MNSTCQTKEGEGEVAGSRQEYIQNIPLADMKRREARIGKCPTQTESDLILHHGGHLRELQTILA